MIDPDAIIAPLRRILGAGVGIAVTDPAVSIGQLLPEEEPTIARAVKARRVEFTAGRVAARQALDQIGQPAVAIPSAPDRSPIWPPGIIGSITHCADLCIALVTRPQIAQGIGVDVEPNTPLDREMLDIICTPAELSWLAAQPAVEQNLRGIEIFCAKESAYKAVYPLMGKVLAFTDMRLTFDPDGTHFTAMIPGAPVIEGSLIRLPQHIICVSKVPPVI